MESLMKLIQYVLSVAGGLTIIAGGFAVIRNAIRELKNPDNERDNKLKEHDKMLDNDNKRMKTLESKQQETDEAIRIMMKSMLALMSHELDGNHHDELKQARDELQGYLIRR